jgi:predicted DNA-binding transcriptional regulator AlpA
VFHGILKIRKEGTMYDNSLYADLTPDERMKIIVTLLSKAVLLRIQSNKDELNCKCTVNSRQKVMRPHQNNMNSKENMNYREQFMTGKEVIKFLKISRTTFWRFRKTTRLPYHVIDNTSLHRYKLSEVIQYVKRIE